MLGQRAWRSWFRVTWMPVAASLMLNLTISLIAAASVLPAGLQESQTHKDSLHLSLSGNNVSVQVLQESHKKNLIKFYVHTYLVSNVYLEEQQQPKHSVHQMLTTDVFIVLPEHFCAVLRELFSQWSSTSIPEPIENEALVMKLFTDFFFIKY